MTMKVPGDGLDGNQMDERAMPPALAKALAAKGKKAVPPAKRDAPAADDLSDMRAASGPPAGDGMLDSTPADGEDKQDTRQLPPLVGQDLAQLNEYPDYSAGADDNSTGIWKKTPDAMSGELPQGSFQRTSRFGDTSPWMQV